MRCPYCDLGTCEAIDVPFTRFQHLGFKNYYQNGKIFRCTKCQLLSNFLDAEKQKDLKNIFESLEYSEGGIASQTYLTSEGKRVTRSYLQAKILSTYLESLPHPSVILDIGCFDGALLRELSKHYPQAELHGFDVNRYVQSIFPRENNFHFYRSELQNINLNCDLICLSFSIFYFRYIDKLISLLKNWLNPNGIIFIQTPNIITNPYSILLGDQFYYFTPAIFKNIFKRIGFFVQFIESSYFPRDILLVAKPLNEPFQVIDQSDNTIFQCLEHLNYVRQTLTSRSFPDKCAVLGTTIAASFVDSILEQRNLFFVDENPACFGMQFRNKQVIHPSSIEKNIHLVIPYGASNSGISERFTRNFQLNQFQMI